MSEARNFAKRGQLVASFLAGSWRKSPPPLGLSLADVRQITPLLINFGAGSLACRRLGQKERESKPLGESYRLDTLHCALYERQLIRLAALFRSSGVDPLLAKGWVVAKAYPETGVRVPCAMDFWIKPEEYPRAADLLRGIDRGRFPVYLHQRSRRLEASWEEMYSRSRLLYLGEAQVRAMGLEDHLRLLCLHALYHGAWNPLWICDIAALVESRPGDFDWDYCTRAGSSGSDRIAAVLNLASELLGAGLEGVPGRLTGGRLPSWLTGSILRNWGGREYHHGNLSVMSCFREPERTAEFLLQLWPNPIHSTVRLGAPLNSLPRFPFQAVDGAYRLIRFLFGFPQPICRNP